MDEGEIDAFGGPPFELILQFALRIGRFREDDQARRVAIDPMDDERFDLAMRAQVLFHLVEQRGFVGLRGERRLARSALLGSG